VLLSALDRERRDFGFNIHDRARATPGGLAAPFVNATRRRRGRVAHRPIADADVVSIPNGSRTRQNRLRGTGSRPPARTRARRASRRERCPRSPARTPPRRATQTGDVRATPGGAETNPGQVGSGGTVGTGSLPLPLFNRPEVVINAAATQLSGTGTSVYIASVAVENGGIIVSGNSSLVRDCFAGMRADGTVGTTYSANYGITVGAGSAIQIAHNYVKVNNSGIRGDAAGANTLVEYTRSTRSPARRAAATPAPSTASCSSTPLRTSPCATTCRRTSAAAASSSASARAP
jgi:hypothetical protein